MLRLWVLSILVFSIQATSARAEHNMMGGMGMGMEQMMQMQMQMQMMQMMTGAGGGGGGASSSYESRREEAQKPVDNKEFDEKMKENRENYEKANKEGAAQTEKIAKMEVKPETKILEKLEKMESPKPVEIKVDDFIASAAKQGEILSKTQESLTKAASALGEQGVAQKNAVPRVASLADIAAQNAKNGVRTPATIAGRTAPPQSSLTVDGSGADATARMFAPTYNAPSIQLKRKSNSPEATL